MSTAIARKRTVLDAGACNFCQRGVTSEDTPEMIYPYRTVYEVSGDAGTVVRFCRRCLDAVAAAMR